jgi:hypothetical protein
VSSGIVVLFTRKPPLLEWAHWRTPLVKLWTKRTHTCMCMRPMGVPHAVTCQCEAPVPSGTTRHFARCRILCGVPTGQVNSTKFAEFRRIRGAHTRVRELARGLHHSKYLRSQLLVSHRWLRLAKFVNHLNLVWNHHEKSENVAIALRCCCGSRRCFIFERRLRNGRRARDGS